MLTPCVFNDLGGSGSRPSISLYKIKRGRGQKKRLFLFPLKFFLVSDGGGFHVLEFDQHDFCVSRILPKRILTSEFLSRTTDKGGSDISSIARFKKDYDYIQLLDQEVGIGSTILPSPCTRARLHPFTGFRKRFTTNPLLPDSGWDEWW